MEKGFGEESPGFRISDLARKVTNVDGKMWGKDGRPLMARRNIIHNTDIGNKDQTHNGNDLMDDLDKATDGSTSGTKKSSASGIDNKGNDDSSSDKEDVHEAHETPKTVVHEPAKVDSVKVSIEATNSGSQTSSETLKPSFASVVNNEKPKAKVAKVNVRKVETSAGPNGEYEAMIPISSVKEVANRLDNSLYGYFIGKRIAFPVVDNYVRNAWGKYGIQKVMMNANGFYFFKFTSSKGVDDVLENGPWMIRTVPIILNKWTPSVCLTKENHNSVPVWVKIHDVPIAAFTADGLSVIASKVGDPLMMDAYTSDMCAESWGRSSYARVMIEVCAKDKLKEQVIVAVPNIEDEGYVCATCRIEYEWRPPQCGECKIFGHSNDACPKLLNPQVNKVRGNSNTDGFQHANRESGKPLADGFQQVKGRNKAKIQNFKQKNKFVYRPVNANGKQSSGGSLKTSNQFESLNKPEASSKQDTAYSSRANTGNLDRGKKGTILADDGKAGKVPSLYEKWKLTDGYEDDDSDDVLDAYDYDMTDFLDSQERQGRRKS